MKSLLSALLMLSVAVAYADDPKKRNKKDDPSQIGNRDVGKGVNFYSPDKEMALGKQLAQEVQRQSKMLEDPIVSEYVNRLGQNLVRNSDAKVPFQFVVIEADSPNAFALPGGYIFVHTGLIRIATEEAELAGALAHEIAHVAARHMTRRATKEQIASLATIPLGAVLGGWTGWGVQQAAGVAVPATFLKFSRNDETEADYLGVQYLYAAGYDPTSAISVFEKIDSLNRTKPGVLGRIFSTHPPDSDRINKTQKEIQETLPARAEYVVNTSEYSQMRERLIRSELRRKNADDKRPTLRVAPGAGKSEPQDEKDDRPTIRRRDLVQ